jgi:hypothetical protein
VLNKYRLFQRANGVFYWQDNESSKQGSLRTKDRKAAEKLLHVKNEAHRLLILNLTMARAYLFAHDPKMNTRAWVAVMREMRTHGIASSHEHCARTFCSKTFDPIRHKPLVQTTAEDLLSIVHNNGHSIAHYLRRLHNLACDLGWLAWPILAKRVWPKIRAKRRRAVTAEEHTKIIANEKNPEKRAYYEFLYETGAGSVCITVGPEANDRKRYEPFVNNSRADERSRFIELRILSRVLGLRYQREPFCQSIVNAHDVALTGFSLDPLTSIVRAWISTSNRSRAPTRFAADRQQPNGYICQHSSLLFLSDL